MEQVNPISRNQKVDTDDVQSGGAGGSDAVPTDAAQSDRLVSNDTILGIVADCCPECPEYVDLFRRNKITLVSEHVQH